jgi:hypothetical protein
MTGSVHSEQVLSFDLISNPVIMTRGVMVNSDETTGTSTLKTR